MKYLVQLSHEIDSVDEDEAKLQTFLKVAQQKIDFKVSPVKVSAIKVEEMKDESPKRRTTKNNSR